MSKLVFVEKRIRAHIQSSSRPVPTAHTSYMTQHKDVNLPRDITFLYKDVLLEFDVEIESVS